LGDTILLVDRSHLAATVIAEVIGVVVIVLTGRKG